MAVIDTSTLIDLIKGRKDAFKTVKKIRDEGQDLRISTISVFELASGNPSGISEKRKFFLSAFSVIPFNEDAAEVAGIVFSKLRKDGQEIDAQDSMISSCAITCGEPLVTRNAKHFQRIEGLEIITY